MAGWVGLVGGVQLQLASIACRENLDREGGRVLEVMYSCVVSACLLEDGFHYIDALLLYDPSSASSLFPPPNALRWAVISNKPWHCPAQLT